MARCQKYLKSAAASVEEILIMTRADHREAFLEYQRRLFSDSIVEAHQKATHLDPKGNRGVNYAELSQSLSRLMKNGVKEGMKVAEFEELVYSLLPELQGKIVLQLPAGEAVRKAA